MHTKLSRSLFSITKVLFLITIIFKTTPDATAASVNPITVMKTAMSVLGPITKSYVNNLRETRETDSINARVWMHYGDKKLNGCGFFFNASGHAGSTAHGYFPDYVEHKCGAKTYQMRMTCQSAMYDKSIHLGNEEVKEIEIHADGYRNTYVDTLCIGLNERTIADGPRAICINNDLLKACDAENRWGDIDIHWNYIMLTKTSRGASKIAFSNVSDLIDSYEKLMRNSEDADSRRIVCENISLAKGTFKQEFWECPATKIWKADGTNLQSSYYATREEDKNPYGCDRNACI